MEKIDAASSLRSSLEPSSPEKIPSEKKSDFFQLEKHHPARILMKNIYGFHSFRPNQEEIIAANLEGRDLFAALSTGSGKSLCYQLPALVREGLTIVVSPLIALMKDQVDAARATGMAVGFLNRSLERKDRHQVLNSLDAHQLKLLYLTPERLAMEGSYQRLIDWNCSAFSIDEAHCISEWGHDFRPDYRQLSRIRDFFPTIPIAAFTATATQRVQSDIIQQLGLRNPHIVRASFNRKELFYRIEAKKDPLLRIANFIKTRRNHSGIIYRATRADVEKTVAYLQKNNIEALPYHAGLSDEIRRTNQEDFKKDKIAIIVATIAFGMGIDKPDIRFVIHGDLPKSIEAYYQETGRAGRDGDNAELLLLWGAGDLLKSRFHIQKIEDEKERQHAKQSLQNMARLAQIFSCRRKLLLSHFDEEHPGDCGKCDVCTGEVETINSSEDARKILSAAIRTKMSFGAHRLVDIVRGTLTDKVREWGHDKLPTFGVGSDKKRSYWLGLIDDLEARNFFFRNEERYKALTITPLGKKLLFGKCQFHSVRRTEGRKEKTHAETLIISHPSGNLRMEAQDQQIFEKLRTLRLTLALQKKIPPYMVFPDRTLRAFAVQRPLTEEALLECPGVGEKKLATWGKKFLELIREAKG